jgi:NitT/TauT family transport system permease protein
MTATSTKGRVPLAVWQVLLGIAALLVWEVLVILGALDKFFFSRPSAIALRVGEWILGGLIWTHLAVTLTEATLAFAIGVALGVSLGFVLARVTWLAALTEPYIRIANALPRVVLAPVFLLWFGLGIWSKVALGVTVVFFIVLFNT